MNKAAALALVRRCRAAGEGHAVRACLALALAYCTVLLIRGVVPAGPAVRFALALITAALAILLLASLADDDRRLRRLARNVADMAGDAAMQTGGVPALCTNFERLGTRMETVERRLLHRHPVSGLPTREPLLRAIGVAIEADTPGLVGVIHFLDLERLQAFDERAADTLLTELAGRIRAMVGADRLVAQVDRARVAIWYGAEPADVAAAHLDALGYALSGAIEIDGRELLPEVRASTALAGRDGASPSAVLARAIAAEAGGPATSVPASAGLDPLEVARERYALEQDLRHAVSRGELELHYQPLVDAGARRVCGAEALLRWRHPVQGLVPPTRFIPIMESAGLSDEIGLWALNAACREAGALRRDGLGALRIAVNISRRQLDGGDLPALVERTLARHSLGPDALEIELTETVATGDTDRASLLFRQLRRLGLSIAIDDFGTGYSSLSTLRTLSFDKIKIDREFVTAVDRRRDSQAICKSVLALGEGLGIRVLAEGVETAEEFAWLRAQGCAHFQGYYFARPLAAHDFHAFVRDGKALDALLGPAMPFQERLRA